MEDAQQHRAQLATMIKDLDQAYYRLERSNAALVAARKVAEDAEHFKTEFITNVSHEIRTPLNLIAGFSDVMLTAPESYDGLALPGPYRSDLISIRRSAQHLLDITEDILNLARIEVGKTMLICEEVALIELVSETTDTVRDLIAAKGVSLNLRIAADLPTLLLDRLRIRQVLLNLLVNAARFTERGSITVAAERSGDEVIVRVCDTGRGIPPTDLAKVFETFHTTAAPTATWRSGVGLGLTISKQYVQLHHGRIGVESIERQGTTFWFTLPYEQTPASAPGEQTSRSWRPYVPLTAPERVIVVVHPRPYIAATLKGTLSGYQIIHSVDFGEGVALAERMQAIALLTHTPPETAPATIPVIVCPFANRAYAAQEPGLIDVLAKPVTRVELLAALEQVDRPVRRVLIVDDDPEMVRLLQRMLFTRFAEHDCLIAYNGRDALQIMASEQPDLILLDLMMPEFNGHDVLSFMARDPQLADIPVIVISASSQGDPLGHVSGPITISRTARLSSGEAIRLIDALLGVFATGWSPANSSAPVPQEAAVG
jgi:signal transduction histidine kinase/CheY-like chemotaxis protein